jgi:hypothetical protein
LRTYGLCGLSVDQHIAEKERVRGTKVSAVVKIAKRKRSTINGTQMTLKELIHADSVFNLLEFEDRYSQTQDSRLIDSRLPYSPFCPTKWSSLSSKRMLKVVRLP